MNNYTQLGAIVAIVLGGYELIKFVVNKFTGNGPSGIRKQIDNMTENHIHELKEITNRIDKRTEEMNLHLIKIIEILRK